MRLANKKENSKSRGFTVIELLIALVVMGILISVGVNAYSGAYAQHELIQKSERLYQFLRLAKSQAIKQNKKIYVHFCQLSNEQSWKMAMTEQPNCDCVVDSPCLLNGSEEMVDGKILFTSTADITFNGDKVSFSPMRFGVNAGSVTFTDIEGNKLKVIQSTMRLRICSPQQTQLGYKKC